MQNYRNKTLNYHKDSLE